MQFHHQYTKMAQMAWYRMPGEEYAAKPPTQSVGNYRVGGRMRDDATDVHCRSVLTDGAALGPNRFAHNPRVGYVAPKCPRMPTVERPVTPTSRRSIQPPLRASIRTQTLSRPPRQTDHSPGGLKSTAPRETLVRPGPIVMSAARRTTANNHLELAPFDAWGGSAY